MDFATFERMAVDTWRRIPDRFKVGVTAFVVDEGAFRKDEFEDGWCYGLCEPDPVMDAIPEAPVCSRITLFHRSFQEIERLARAEGEPFDWEGEIEETVRHELQHHLEWRAGEDGLGDEDDVQDDNERRLTGLPFTPGFHRWGTPLGSGAWLADGDLFVEAGVRRNAWRRLGDRPLFHLWQGLRVVAEEPVPAELLAPGEALYLPARIEDAPDDTAWPWRDVVLVAWRRGWFGW